MKVLFLQTAHRIDDDRVCCHQRVSLEAAGHSCAFASSAKDVTERPDVVICDNPTAIRQARKAFRGSVPVVYDITEWYPSKKNLRNVRKWLKPFKALVLVLANVWAGCNANAFLFGEYYKAKPFRILFPWKRYMYLPYYPSLRYIEAQPPRDLTKEVRLFYAGPQTKEKGYERVQQVAKLCQKKNPDRHFVLTAVNGLSFKDFCQEITKHDIFLDLRDDDKENTYCLPIKLFYYMAVGKPVVYSDLLAIRHGVPEIAEDSLVSPKDTEQATQMICDAISDQKRYAAMCLRNRRLVETKYNWEQQNKSFVQFIESLIL